MNSAQVVTLRKAAAAIAAAELLLAELRELRGSIEKLQGDQREVRKSIGAELARSGLKKILTGGGNEREQ